MSGFRLTETQTALQDTVGRLAKSACDRGVRRAAIQGGDGFDPDFWRELLALGVAGIAVSEDHGGLGLGLVELALVAEALGREAAPGPFLGHVLATLAIETCGSETQKRRWLPDLATGHRLATIALGSKGASPGPEHWGLPRDAQGRVSGQTAPALYPWHADLLILGSADEGLAVVDLKTEGVVFQPLDGVDRTRRLGTIIFTAATVEELDGPHRGAEVFDALMILLAADAFGGASRLLEMTVEHVLAREQFGGPIGRFQAVKHQLANLAAEVEPARGLLWLAAVAHDEGRVDRSRIAALAKAHLADRYNHAARVAVELHGGIGYTWDHPLHIWLKRALFDAAYGGAPAAQRARAWAMREAAIGSDTSGRDR